MELYPFQDDCVNWLLDTESKGALLAAQMGLGKTVMALALIRKTLPQQRALRQCTLYVTPWKLIQNIINTNFNLFNGEMSVGVYHRQFSLHAPLEYTDILLVSYDKITFNIEYFESRSFFRIIYDESHLMNRIESKLVSVLARAQTTRTVLMTGTPFYRGVKDIVLQLNAAGVDVRLPGQRVTMRKLSRSPQVKRHVRFVRYGPDTLRVAPLNVEPVYLESRDLVEVVTGMVMSHACQSVVFSNNNRVLRAMYDVLGDKHAILIDTVIGRTSHRIYKAMTEFKHRCARILLLHTRVGSHGFDLSNAQHMYFTTPSGNALQVMARVHRPGGSRAPRRAFVVMEHGDVLMHDMMQCLIAHAQTSG